jgi:hypothetical protein
MRGRNPMRIDSSDGPFRGSLSGRSLDSIVACQSSGRPRTGSEVVLSFSFSQGSSFGDSQTTAELDRA